MKRLISKNVFIVFFIAVLLSIAYFSPLIPHFFKGIPYTFFSVKGFEITRNFQGDHLQYLYHLALFGEAVKGNIPFFSMGYQFATPYSMPYLTPYFPPFGFLFFLFSFLGYAGAYNLMVIISIIVSYVSMYYLLRRYGIGNAGGILGGVVFSFFPYKVASLCGGHPSGMFVSFIPLFYLLLDILFEKKNIRYSVLVSIVLLFFTFSEPHYLYFTVLSLPFYVIFFIVREKVEKSVEFFWEYVELFGKKINKYALVLPLFSFLFIFFKYSYKRGINGKWLVLSAFLCVFFLFFLYFYTFVLSCFFEKKEISKLNKAGILFFVFNLLFYFVISGKEYKHSLLFYGLFLLLTPLVIFWDSKIFFRKIKKYYCFALKFINEKWFVFVPFLISLIGSIIYMFIMKKLSLEYSMVSSGRSLGEIMLYSPRLNDLFKMKNPGLSKFVYPGFVAFGLAALGILTFFIKFIRRKLNSKEFIIGGFFLFIFSVSFILSFGPNFQFLPLYEIARRYIPFFSFIRNTTKIYIYSAISIAFFSSYFINEFLPKKKKFMFSILFLCVFGEYYNAANIGVCILEKTNKVLVSLKEAKNGKVAYIPIWPGDSSWSSVYQYFSLITKKYMINGYQPIVSKDYKEKIADALYNLNFGRITKKEYALLKKLNVKYIVFHKEAFPRKVSPFPEYFTNINLRNSNCLNYICYDDPLYLYVVSDLKKCEEGKSVPVRTGFCCEFENFEVAYGNAVLKRDERYSALCAMVMKKGRCVLKKKIRFPDGEYDGFVYLKIRGNTDKKGNSVIKWYIKDNKGRQILNKSIVVSKSVDKENLKINFAVDFEKPAIYEFNLEKDSDLYVEADFFYMKFSKNKDPLLYVKPYDGIFIGEIMENGKYVSVSDDKYNRGPVCFSPNRLYEKGKYLVEFVMMWSGEDKFLNENVAKIYISDTYAKKVFSQKRIKGIDFKRKIWNKFLLEFELSTDLVCNFGVDFEGKGHLKVKCVEIKKIK